MKTMKQKCTAILLVCVMTSQALAVEPTLLVTKAGYFNVYVDANGVPQTPVKIQNVVVIGDTPTPPPGGGDIPTPPPTTGLSAAIAEMSKTKITSADEGTALAMAVNLLSKSISDDASVQPGLDGVVSVVGLGLNAKTRVDAWYAGLKAVPGFTFTRAGLKATLDGLNQAYGVDSAVSSSLVDTVMDGAASGQTVEQISATVGATYPNSAFDFTMIMTILMALIDLLTKLGILS